MYGMGRWTDLARRTADAALALSMPGGRHVASILLHVEGYLYPHEALYLFWLACTAPDPANIVEVGSLRGRSTLSLAAGLRQRGSGRVYAVDPHVYGTLDALRSNIERFRLGSQVTVVPEPSAQVGARWREPVQAVFIDGDHRRAAVEADVCLWLPRVAPGGLLAIHDSTELSGHEGPRQVAKEVCRVGDEFDAVGTLASITWARRRGGARSWIPPEHGKRLLDPIIRQRAGMAERERRRGGA
jgi:MMP 1-O-methyltransferase